MSVEQRAVRQYHFQLFPPELLRLGVIPTPGKPGEAIPTSYAQIPALWPGTLGAINGPMASYGAHDPHDYDTWTTALLDSAYFQAEGGLDIPPRRPAMGLTVGVRTKTTGALEAYAARGWQRDPAARVAVQLPFGMVAAGRVGAGLDRGNLGQRTARALLGIHQNGRAMFGGGVGSCQDCAAAAVEAGCLVAGYLDGGCSYNQEFSVDQLHGTRCDRRTPSRILIASDGATPPLVALTPLPCNTNTCRPLHAGAPGPGPSPAPQPARALAAPAAPSLVGPVVAGLLLTGAVAAGFWYAQRKGLWLPAGTRRHQEGDRAA
jgi:hypothetical protein